MATRVLILNRQLAFAVKIKQALEQTGLFDVHPFTKADTAFDFLRDHPQDVALVDFTLPGRSGAKTIQQLRDIQPDLAVVVSPRQSDSDVEMLNVQGMIDAPFNARDVIPLIENALNQSSSQPQARPAQTRLLVDDSSVDQNRIATAPLDEEAPVRERSGKTQRLDEPVYDSEPPVQTRILGDTPSSKPHSPAQTRKLDEDDSLSSFEGQTYNLNQESEAPATGQTRNFSDEISAPPVLGQTNILSEDELNTPKLPPTRVLEEPLSPPQQHEKTRKLEEDISPPNTLRVRKFDNQPPAPPEISSLDAVLKSFGFDPPIEEEDTPAVPTKDSDALRQYLATSDRADAGDTFDNILGAIDPDSIENARKQTDEFSGLVRSLQGADPHTPLPGRQQQTMDFTLTTGMDSVLREIEKTKTSPLVQPETLPEENIKTTTFEKLADEEPPMPTLEESGTVSDLLLGISDRGFRNVLSLLRGDEIEEGLSGERGSELASQDMDEAFRDFFGTTASRQMPENLPEDPDQIPSIPTPPEITPVGPDFDLADFPQESEADEGATIARVVLQTTLDESQFPKGFSVDRLISDIEDRLAAHRLNIRPLPSWDMDTTAFRAIIDQAEIREPSFLPEEFPPGEMVSTEEQLTRLSSAVHERQADYREEPDVNYLEDTIPSERMRLEEESFAVADEDAAPGIDDILSSFGTEEDPYKAAIEPSWVEEKDETSSSSEFDGVPAFDALLTEAEARETPLSAVEPSWIEEENETLSDFDTSSTFDALLQGVENRNIPTAVEPSWVEEEAETPPEFDDIPDFDAVFPEVQAGDSPAPSAEALSNFAIDHMFDDMLTTIGNEGEDAYLPEAESWDQDEEEAPPEVQPVSGLDELFSPADPGRSAIEEPVWVDEPVVRRSSDKSAKRLPAEPDWIDANEESWAGSADIEPAVESEADVFAFVEDEVRPEETTSFIEDTLEQEPSQAEINQTAIEATSWDLPQELPEEPTVTAEAASPASLSPEEAYIAQLALNLTQVSLELSSEGSIITRGSEIAAFAGHLSQIDALELRDVIHNDWEVDSNGARLRFITLPSSGKDYMLYSIRTVNNLVLSMIFAGTTPLRVIRQQGQRLIEALEAIPESPVEEAAPIPPAPQPAAITPVESTPPVALDDYAYVWLVRDPNQRLSDAVSHAISTGLTTQLNELRWKIQSLEVDESYIYLFAGVPGDTPAYQVIGDLQRRSAEIASTQDQNLTPQTLWADSYLVLTPGREMSRDEIQEFIDFQRMM